MLGKVIQNLLVMLVMFVISSCFLRETTNITKRFFKAGCSYQTNPYPKLENPSQKGHKCFG